MDLFPVARVEFYHENAVEEDIFMTQETLVNQVNELYDV